MKKTTKSDLFIVTILLIVGSLLGYGIRTQMEPKDPTPIIDLRKADSLLTPTPSYYPYK